jgi:hypothetical protein
LVAAAGVAMLFASTAQAQQVGTAAFKCAGGLAKVVKAATFVEKFVGKCATDYHKRALFLVGEKFKDDSAIDKSGELCETFVGSKALSVITGSPIDTSNCGADDLQALGFPTHWSTGDVNDILTINALHNGLMQAGQVAPDLWQIMEDVAGRGCTSCETLRNAFGGGINNGVGPCQAHVCGLTGGSNITVQTSVLNVGVPTSGTLNLDLCQFPSVTGNDYFAYSGPSRTIKAQLTGLADVCVVSTATRGYIAGAGSARQVADFETCQDHIVGNGTCSTTTTTPCAVDGDCPATETCAGNTEVDGCVGTGLNGTPFAATDCAAPALEGNCSVTTGTVCQTDPDCPVTETCVETLVTGGACFRSINAAAAGAGDASIQATLFNTVVTSGDVGPDTIPCTADDTADPAAPVPVVLTTASADGIIYNNNRGGTAFNIAATNGSGFSLTGANSIEDGNLAGTVVTVFPTLSLDVSALVPNTFLDGIIDASLTCQNP